MFISVLRNLNRPVFFPAVYRKTVREDTVVGTYIEKLNVTDPDGVSGHFGLTVFPCWYTIGFSEAWRNARNWIVS